MRALSLALSCIAVLLSSIAAQAEKRVAFVVGNGAYKHVAPLPNPPLDAKAMSRLLRNAGFDVVEGSDLGRDAMTAKLRDFSIKTQGADVALFFYAGHGISVNGKNYLIPIDADLKSEMDIKFGAAIDVDLSLDQTMSDAKVKLVFLDACRDNPFAAKVRSAARTRNVTVGSGLSEIKSGEGTLIAFATAPGQTALDGEKGGNSPFTKALLSNLTTPGVEIQQAMTSVRRQVNDETNKQQLPWANTNLIGSVYINGAAPEPAAPGAAPLVVAAAPATAAANPGTEVELEFWRSIRDSRKVEEFDAYLLKYPNGQFRSIASARVAALQSGQPEAPATTRNAPAAATPDDPAIFTSEATLATEEELNFNAEDRRDLQKRLTAIGFKTHVNGRFNDDTRRAIMRWQTAHNYPKTGYLNPLQHQALLKESLAVRSKVSEVSDDDQPAPAPKRERAQRSSGGGGGGGGGGGNHRSNGPPNFFGGGGGGMFRGGPFGR